jgi:hypothetical protein
MCYLRMTFKYWEWAPWKRAIKTVWLRRTWARTPRRSWRCVAVLKFRIRLQAGETPVCFSQSLTCMMALTPARTSEASTTQAAVEHTWDQVRPIRFKEQDSHQKRPEHNTRSPGRMAQRTLQAKETSRFSCITLRMSPANMEVRTQPGQLWLVRWTRLQKQTQASTRCQIHLQRIRVIQTSIMQSRLTLNFLARGMRMHRLVTNSSWWKTIWLIIWELTEIIEINWIYSRIRIWKGSAISLEWIRSGQRVR